MQLTHGQCCHGLPGCLLGVLDCLAGMMTLSLSPATTFARHAPIWSPSNSNRPTFVASASSHSRSSLVGSGFRPVSSPGEDKPVPGYSQQRLAHPQSQVCVINTPCCGKPCYYYQLRRDTTRTRHRTTQYDLRLTLMLCLFEFDTACAPGCVHLTREGQHSMAQQSWEPLSNAS